MPVVVMPFSLSLYKRVNTTEHRDRQAAGIMMADAKRETDSRAPGEQESNFPSSWLLLCTMLPVEEARQYRYVTT